MARRQPYSQPQGRLKEAVLKKLTEDKIQVQPSEPRTDSLFSDEPLRFLIPRAQYILNLPIEQRAQALYDFEERYNLDEETGQKLYDFLRYQETYQGPRTTPLQMAEEIGLIAPKELPLWQQAAALGDPYLQEWQPGENIEKVIADVQAAQARQQFGEAEQLAVYERMWPDIVEGIRQGFPLSEIWTEAEKESLPPTSEQMMEMYLLVSREIPKAPAPTLPEAIPPVASSLARELPWGFRPEDTLATAGWRGLQALGPPIQRTLEPVGRMFDFLTGFPSPPRPTLEETQEAMRALPPQAGLTPPITTPSPPPSRPVPPLGVAAVGALGRQAPIATLDPNLLRKLILARLARPQISLASPRRT